MSRYRKPAAAGALMSVQGIGKRKRPRYRPRSGMYNPLPFGQATKAAAAVMYGRASALKPETKYFDVSFTSANTAAGTTWADTEVEADFYVNASGTPTAFAGSYFSMLPTAVGSSYGQVDGNRFLLKRIRVKGKVIVPVASDQADVTQAATVRMLLVMDTQPNGAQAQGEDIMQDVGGAGENQFSFKRIAGQAVGRFRILRDETIVLQQTVAATDGANTNTQAVETGLFSWTYSPIKPIQVNIASGNSVPATAGLLSHNIFMLCYGLRGSGTVQTSVIASSRCYYCD